MTTSQSAEYGRIKINKVRDVSEQRRESKVKPMSREQSDMLAKHSQAETEKSAKEIRALHRKGVRVAKWLDQNGGYRTDAADRAAERFRLRSADEARKLARLATPETGFTEVQINQLTQLAIEQGFRLRPTPLKRLLAIREPSERMAKALRMIEDGWSQSRTEAEVREHNAGPGHQAAAGRKPRVPATSAQLLDEFVRLSVRWVRLADAARGSDGAGATEAWMEIRRGKAAISEVTRLLRNLPSKLDAQS